MAQPRILVVDDNPELLALLSSSFEEAGYSVQTALRGRNALDFVKKEKFDLAVLDVLLPDVMGFDVAEALRRLKVPFVFMSGVHKGGKAASTALGKYGAAGYFEKPFDRSALLALVEKLVPASALPGAGVELNVEDDDEVEGDADAMQLTGRIDLISGNTTASIRGEKVNLRAQKPALARPAKGVPGSRPSSPPMLGKVSYASREGDDEALDFAAKRAPQGADSVPPPPDALQELPRQGAVRRGELRDNLPHLLAAFATTRETGELGLQRGQVKKIVYFEQGMPVFALSNLVADRLGQFLVRAGKIDEETLKKAADEAGKKKQRTGDILILMGTLTEQDRLYYVGQQIKSILYSLFSWEDGTYQMSFQQRARKETIKLDLHPATLIMRGIKKLYKPERLRRLLAETDKPAPAPDPLFSLSDVELAAWEAHLLPKCDGSRTVRELLALSQRPGDDALATLVGLYSMHILETKRAG